MKISAAIFDLDGTLIDSESEWGMAFVEVLKDLAYTSPDSHPQVTGVSVRKNWEIIIDRLGIKTDKSLDELEALTCDKYLKNIDSITLKPDAIEFVKELKDAGIKVSLATTSNWLMVDKIFESLNLTNIFDVVTTGEEVINQKPDPDIFLVTADKLGEKEENCLVIENSAPGVSAAHDAGMKVIVIADNEEEKSDLSNADLIVSSFAEITPKVIEEL